MPQMMPINWLIFFFFFLMIFMIFNTLNYYIFIYKSNFKNIKMFKMNNFNWKW